MALVIEDGSQVAGANSYVSLATAKSYASARGSTAMITEAKLIEAMDYLESLRADYQGMKISGDQPLQWPRVGVVVDDFPIDEDEIPSCLKAAQCQLAMDATSVKLLPTGDRREVTSESYAKGVVAKTYATGLGGSPKPRLTAADALLAPLLKSAANDGVMIRTVRV